MRVVNELEAGSRRGGAGVLFVLLAFVGLGAGACGGKEAPAADDDAAGVVAPDEADAIPGGETAPPPVVVDEAGADASATTAPSVADAEASAPEGDGTAPPVAEGADAGEATAASVDDVQENPSAPESDAGTAEARDAAAPEPADPDASSAPPADAVAAAVATDEDAVAGTSGTEDVAAAPSPRPAAPTTTLSGEDYLEFKFDAVAVALSADGRYLAAGDLGGRLSLWDTENKRLLIQDTLPEGNRVHRIAFGVTSPVLVSGTFGTPDAPLRVWQVKPAGRRHTLGREGWQVSSLALDAGGAQALGLVDIGAGKLKVMIWGVDDGEERYMASVLSDRAFVAFSGDGATAALSDAGGFIHVYRGAPWAELYAKRIEGATSLQRLALSEDGRTLWGTSANHIFRYDITEAPVLTATVNIGDAETVVSALDPVSHGRVVAVERPEAGGLRVWDSDQGKLLAEVVGGCRCESHAVSAQGGSIACDCVPDAVVRVWRLPTPL